MKEFKYKEEIEHHLVYDIAPFWKKLRDDEYGGYYGFVDYELNLDEKAVKGCILNSRITWFFANAYDVTGDDSLLSEARHGYEFLRDHFVDRENGGVYWSLKYDGTPEDTTKHTYNQAFAIYALSSYYAVSKDSDALNLAYELYDVIEEKCRDEGGYLEAFKVDFSPESNEKLSENGVMADRTMNTMLHVYEAYTELYRVGKNDKVADRLREILNLFAEKVYNPELHRQEVFFDHDYNSLIDLISYGHDIESSWLIDRGVSVLGDPEYEAKIYPITRDLCLNIFKTAFDGHSTANECERGKVDPKRVWWVQAEALLGYLNGYRKDPSKTELLEAAEAEWEFIRDHVIDPRSKEWYMHVDAQGNPETDKPIVDPWKCPYHNGRMCIEIIRMSE